MREETLRTPRGFTLTELLVVIAIITILATIVTPNLIGFIGKSRTAATLSDLQNAETVLNGMLADAGVDSFEDFLTPEARFVLRNYDTYMTAPPTGLTPVEHQALLYDTMFYLLLRLGRDAALEENIEDNDDTNDNWTLRELFVGLDTVQDSGGNDLNAALGEKFYFENVAAGDPDPNSVFDLAVINKLQTSYLDLNTDSWGQRYHFWMGPLDRTDVRLRSFRVDTTDPTVEYVYDAANRDILAETIIGLPPADDELGYPAPYDLNVYIWSNGPNELLDAHLDLVEVVDAGYSGGGDDVNSWDGEAGWTNAPRPD